MGCCGSRHAWRTSVSSPVRIDLSQSPDGIAEQVQNMKYQHQVYVQPDGTKLYRV